MYTYVYTRITAKNIFKYNDKFIKYNLINVKHSFYVLLNVKIKIKIKNETRVNIVIQMYFVIDFSRHNGLIWAMS